ncbi:hypothetical protein C8F01DRAFT_1362978 [Mycena amicta]|nr:hypothetical protein C8F01DRAFT_1362978 [Mycena amicta]
MQANRLFAVMLEDLVMDVTLQSHREVSRSLSVCAVCQTRCSAVHVPPPLASQASPSRPSTPVPNGSGGTGTSTPTKEGNLYLSCLVCSRQIASSRYASHLSSCLGLGTTRRTAARGSAMKSKPSSDAGGRSTSPDDDFSDDEKSKGKSRTKLDGDFNLKRKRQDSPHTPNKKHKNHSASGSPVHRIKADPDFSTVLSHALASPSTNSTTSKVPSKLRDSSTASLVERSLTPSSRGYSSPPPDSPGASSYSANGSPIKRGHAKDVAPPKQPSPARMVNEYFLDDSGDETGSSTDTDS